jgi:hypothetical protein
MKIAAHWLVLGVANRETTADVMDTMSGMRPAMPALTVTESGDLVRLQLGGFARGCGASLQEAADDLIHSVLTVVMAIRSSGFASCSELPPDLDTMNFLYELGEFAASGGDIRERVFG